MKDYFIKNEKRLDCPKCKSEHCLIFEFEDWTEYPDGYVETREIYYCKVCERRVRK